MGFTSFLFGKKPKIETKPVVDKLKQSIAQPLSSFLKSQIGQGVPRFEGDIVGGAEDIPQVGSGGISEFLKLDPNQFFTENVQNPAIQTFKEDFFPLVREQFAGSLSSSGRFRTEEESVSKFTRGLAQARANFNLELPQTQFDIAMQLKTENDKQLLSEYGEFIRTQPHYYYTPRYFIAFIPHYFLPDLASQLKP